MKNKENKRIIVATDRARLRTGSVIAALIAAVALFAVMMQLEKRLLTEYERGVILVAAREIPKGQLMTRENLAEYFLAREVDRECIPATALTDPEQLQEMRATYDIEEGVLLTEGMFDTMEYILRDMCEPVVAGCKAEDLYQMVGGILRAGDTVHIYSVTEEGTDLIWQNVFVQQVFDSSGSSIDNGDKTSAAQRINIYLEKKDVERFYDGLAEGSLRVVKVCDE